MANANLDNLLILDEREAVICAAAAAALNRGLLFLPRHRWRQSLLPGWVACHIYLGQYFGRTNSNLE